MGLVLNGGFTACSGVTELLQDAPGESQARSTRPRSKLCAAARDSDETARPLATGGAKRPTTLPAPEASSAESNALSATALAGVAAGAGGAALAWAAASVVIGTPAAIGGSIELLEPAAPEATAADSAIA